MKRTILHIIFWTLYISQDTLLAYLWNSGRRIEFTTSQQLMMALKLCVALLPPKIIFTYALLYFFLDKLLNQDRQKGLTIAIFLSYTIVTVIVTRCIEIFFVYPVLYHNAVRSPSFASAFGFLFTFIDLGYVSGIAVAIKQFRLQLLSKEKEKLLIKEKLETELKYLRNQTNPHFLFNTLNNIYGLARKKSDNTAEVVMRLSKLLRFMIYETRSQFIKIGDEVKMLENFISLEEIRYTRKLTVNFKKNIDNENEMITPLLLLPFVENAFKHGVGENRFDSYINIDLQLTDGELLFYIENTKETNNKEEIIESVGLGNVKRQLELMYNQYELDVKNDAVVFKVTLNVNLRSYANL